MYYILDTKQNDLLRWSCGKIMGFRSDTSAKAAALTRNIRCNSKRYLVLGLVL